MLNHSKPHVRKRAVVALYKVFTKYPEIVSLGMPRLREKLEDPDSGIQFPYISLYTYLHRNLGVVTATVNVLCELSRQNPKDYLVLAPQLFHLLTTSSNNWTLIKIIKLVRIRELGCIQLLTEP
jgi:AP-3 complex subunit delta-1